MSETSYDFSAAARLDLLNIWNYLAETASLEVADAIFVDIEEGIRHLIKFPDSGHERPDLTSRPLHFFKIQSYLLIYYPKQKPLHILRVIHSARDIKRLLN